MGSRNHEVVPTSIIVNVGQLQKGGSMKMINDLAKNNLIARVMNNKCKKNPSPENLTN